MLGLDSNVLIRYLVRDDPDQFERARRLIAHEARGGRPPLVSQLVLLETEWVLRSRYGLAKAEILTAFNALLEADDFRIEDESSVEQAIYVWKDSAVDFADCLIGARHRQLGCRATATFDRRAEKVAGFVGV